MTWRYDRSEERVKTHLQNIGEIEVEPLVREMDLENLSETVCRQIYGAHVYAEIRNLSTLVNAMTADTDRRRVIQAAHIYQREVARIIDAVGGVRIHFQGGRVHALIYRPIRDGQQIASKAVSLQLIMDRFGTLFSTEFATLPDLRIRSGSDVGEAIGTRNGTQGDRELLFLGAPANYAAKLLMSGSDRRLTERVSDLLPKNLAGWVEDDPEGGLCLRRPTPDELSDLLKKQEIEWTADASSKRMADDRELFPATKATLSGAEEMIDFDALSFYDNKLVEAASLYGDVSGFTAYIDGAKTKEDQKKALRAFHAVRLEMARVVQDDFEGVRVQFQGDRVQALFHLPENDAAGFSAEAVSAAVGLQSSFELVLKKQVSELTDLGIAVGVSQGTTVATKLGERGHRDRICLGNDVLRAERNEENVHKQQIGISGNVREQLAAELAKHFVWVDTASCYVATGLTQNKLDLEEGATAIKAGKVYISSGATGTVLNTEVGRGRARVPAPSHGV